MTKREQYIQDIERLLADVIININPVQDDDEISKKYEIQDLVLHDRTRIARLEKDIQDIKTLLVDMANKLGLYKD